MFSANSMIVVSATGAPLDNSMPRTAQADDESAECRCPLTSNASLLNFALQLTKTPDVVRRNGAARDRTERGKEQGRVRAPCAALRCELDRASQLSS